MKYTIVIGVFFFLGANLIANAQNRHMMCMGVPIEGTFDDMEQKFYNYDGRFGTVAEDRTLRGPYYDRYAYVKILGPDECIWGVQLEIDTVFNTKAEARLLQKEYEERISKRYWSVFEDGLLPYYYDYVEKWGITDSRICSIKSSGGELLGYININIQKYYGDESKYQVYITYVDEKNWCSSGFSSPNNSVIQSTIASDDTGDLLSIREAMDIVAFRRHYPLAEYEAEGKYIESVLNKHYYVAKDFLEGVGTCSFWQYIKHGHAKYDNQPDDAFVPDNFSLASNVAVIDCDGIETIEYDETSISVDIRVYGTAQRDALVREMKQIGFRFSKSDQWGKDYVWKSYHVRIHSGISRGYNYLEFSVSLEPIDYASTKKYSFADSTRLHNYQMNVDFLVNGNQGLKQSVNAFIKEAFHIWPPEEDNPVREDLGDWSTPQNVINYYGMRDNKRIRNMIADDSAPFVEETLNIHKIAETDQYISFEVIKYGHYGGVTNYCIYGATFRKSDGKQMRIIQSPESPQFKSFLKENVLSMIDHEGLMDEYKYSLPFPQYEPYLIQTGVRFVYQKYEISYGMVGYIKEDVSFPVVKNHLTNEVKDLLKDNNVE